ncbi:uncharacterized protein DUF397 [Streptomyces sp. Amel2xB2]|uniref:DUF397 domain-containing protein n=1 Tax=Streptomyces sp. Amel2xB2 TaxID=1305829 RepID=UPI000DBA8BC0|nr:DUF397 domain-containing protein [Streptomyces sp. Amel2xB2]RAJ71804.1 uncharacterized protein DUF397 [Streptomyces sp. Amel2xB2]
MGGERAWFKSSYSNTEGGNCLEVALSWRKSSYSNDEGGNCVEVAASWRKSSHSNTEGGECVEVASCPHTVHVRDSKRGDAGPQLAFPADAWSAFLRSSHNG